MNRQLTSPGFQQHARNVVGSQGLTPGFPTQWHYLEKPGHPSHATPENVNIYVNGEIGILQNKKQFPIVGDYKPIWDEPFDPIGYEAKQDRMNVLGFSFLALGAYLM